MWNEIRFDFGAWRFEWRVIFTWKWPEFEFEFNFLFFFLFLWVYLVVGLSNKEGDRCDFGTWGFWAKSCNYMQVNGIVFYVYFLLVLACWIGFLHVGFDWKVIMLWCDADSGGAFFSSGRVPQDYPMKVFWKRGFIRLVLVAGIAWMLLILLVLLFHVWSCQSSLSFFSGILCIYLAIYLQFIQCSIVLCSQLFSKELRLKKLKLVLSVYWGSLPLLFLLSSPKLCIYFERQQIFPIYTAHGRVWWQKLETQSWFFLSPYNKNVEDWYLIFPFPIQ